MVVTTIQAAASPSSPISSKEGLHLQKGLPSQLHMHDRAWRSATPAKLGAALSASRCGLASATLCKTACAIQKIAKCKPPVDGASCDSVATIVAEGQCWEAGRHFGVRGGGRPMCRNAVHKRAETRVPSSVICHLLPGRCDRRKNHGHLQLVHVLRYQSFIRKTAQRSTDVVASQSAQASSCHWPVCMVPAPLPWLRTLTRPRTARAPRSRPTEARLDTNQIARFHPDLGP
jgi:hypothetical protein